MKFRVGGTAAKEPEQASGPGDSVVVYLGVGSNLGNRQDMIARALESLQSMCKIVEVSGMILTDPVGYLDQPDFLNGVVQVETKLGPGRLLGFLKDLEQKLGRQTTVPNGPRCIDLDILFYGDRVMITKDLRIPHPRLHQRRFVLEPLAEIAPDFVHPVLRKTIAQLLESLGSEHSGEIRLLPGVLPPVDGRSTI